MAGLQDEYTQRNGIVVLLINMGPSRWFFEEVHLLQKAHQFTQAMPHHIAALHYVYDDVLFFPVVTFFRFLLGTRVKGRFITHLGRFSQVSRYSQKR